MKILENFINNQNVIKECCSLIAILLTDDDLRVPFGKASDRAQEFVKRGMLTKLLNLVKGKLWLSTISQNVRYFWIDYKFFPSLQIIRMLKKFIKL